MDPFLSPSDVREQVHSLVPLNGLPIETQLGKQGNEGRTDTDTCTKTRGLGGALLSLMEQHQLCNYWEPQPVSYVQHEQEA